MKFLFLLFICLIFILPGSVGASGQVGISVSPQIFEMGIFPGETISRRIQVGNLSEAPLPLTVRVIDFTAQEDSGEMIFDEASQDPSIASWTWFEIEKPYLILEPGEKRHIHFSINVPENAEPRSYYSLMIFEPRLPSFYFEEYEIISDFEEEWITAPRVIPTVGVPFLTSIKTFALDPEVKEKLEVVEFSLPGEERMLGLENILSRMAAGVAEAAEFTVAEKAPSKFILRIKNNDIYHIKPFGKISIYNIFGGKVGEAEVPQKTILPGKTHSFPVEFSLEAPEYLKWLPSLVSDFLVKNFFFGKYRAELELEAKTPLTAEVFRPASPFVLVFFSLPWHFWLPFILIFSTLIFLTIKYRKRIFLAFKTLIKPEAFR